MRVFLRAYPGSSREEVVIGNDGDLKVYVRQSPVDGKANKALIAVLSGHYKVKKSSIRIITGSTSRNKIIEINS